MTYLPLARKYRPQTFEELVGQPHVTATLSRALAQKRLAQAYLFTGQRGVGKTSAARILAKCLNCQQGPAATPCNACASCAAITQGSSLDVIEIDGASNRGIDEIRGLRETVPFAPASGPFRVYIIDEVHMLTAEAFNALLKTLEEPPAHVKFIFATTAAHKVPPTILSRCQRFDFRRVEAATVVGVLRRLAKAEKLTVTEPALFAIARASDGSLRDAEVVFEQLASFVQGEIGEADVTALLGAVESDALFAWAQAVLDRDAPAALGALLAQLERGRDPAQLLAGLLRHLRNLLVVRTARESGSRAELLPRLVDEPAERLKRLDEQAGVASPQELLLLLQILAGAYELVRRSPMAQTILELVVIKLATREQWQSLDEISRRLEQLSAGHLPPAVGGRKAMPSPAECSEAARGAPTQHVAPMTKPTTSPDASQDLQLPWNQFLEQLSAQKMSLAAYLMEARPLRWEQGALTVGLPAFALHQEVVTVAENRRLIDRLLTEVWGVPTTAQYTTLPDAPEPAPARPSAKADAEAPPIVQDIVKLFNATILDQPRPT